jgi:hypothetical protein
MRRLKQCLALAAVPIVLSVPSYAMGAPIVPPGNSAVNQYTQTIPTPGGDVEVHGKGSHSPADKLGPKVAHKLNRHGSDGKATARLAASTSPPGTSGGGTGGGPGSTGHGGKAGSGAPTNPNLPGSPPGTHATSPGGDSAANGSSGFGQVLGQATGATSSGKLGLLLPLAIFAVLLWCAAYFWRQRRTA